MPINVNFVAAKISISKLREMLHTVKEDNRKKFYCEVEEFTKKMKEKYDESN